MKIGKKIRYLMMQLMAILTILISFNRGLCFDKAIDIKKNGTGIQDQFSFSDFDNRLTLLSFSVAAVGGGLHFGYDAATPVFEKEDVNAFDRAVFEEFKSDRVYTTYGSISSLLVFPWIASPFIYFSFKEAYPDNLRKNYIMLQSLALSMGLQQITSKAVGRERPDGTDNESFYSGHTANAFCAAAFYAAHIKAENSGRRSLFSISPYLAATALSYGRIEENKHFLTDVLAGAAIGTVIGKMFCRKYYDKNGKFIKKSTRIHPWFSPEKNGGMLAVRIYF